MKRFFPTVVALIDSESNGFINLQKAFASAFHVLNCLWRVQNGTRVRSQSQEMSGFGQGSSLQQEPVADMIPDQI
jgi:hypothetical protein